MNLELDNKVVLITGGAKGIGAAITRAVAQEHAIPIVVDRDAAAAKDLLSKLESEDLSAHFIEYDLSSASNCQTAIQHALSIGKRLDALVNNAGVNDGVGLEKAGPAKFVASLERNLFHYYNMAHYALPSLKAAKGAIVNIASKVAVTGQGGTSGYAAAKGAILSLTREWSVELLPFGIRVNAVLPAEVMTPLYRQWLDTLDQPEQKLASIVAKIPFEKRMTTAEEIAGLVAFLISARAGHIVGQHLYVDGGYVHLDRAAT
jgi:L-fucose dehydrogenase